MPPSASRVTAFWFLALAIGCHMGYGQVQTPDSSADLAPPASEREALTQPDHREQSSREPYVPEWYGMFANIPGDWTRFAGKTFTVENIPGFVGMAGLTVALIATDEQTWRLSERWYNSSATVQRLSDFFVYIGDGRPQFGLAAGFALWGFAAGDKRALTTGSQLVQAILSCGIVVQTLKHMTGRESPFLETRPGGNWDFFPNQITYHKHVPKYDAYPSGHIATALATVTVVAENYPEWTWVKPVGYLVVSLIGVGMANTGIHWYSDYPLGLFLGYSFGMLAAHPVGVGRSADGSIAASVTFAPVFTRDGARVLASITF
jgi:membrane-associated phospholipid phosphatase